MSKAVWFHVSGEIILTKKGNRRLKPTWIELAWIVCHRSRMDSANCEWNTSEMDVIKISIKIVFVLGNNNLLQNACAFHTQCLFRTINHYKSLKQKLYTYIETKLASQQLLPMWSYKIRRIEISLRPPLLLLFLRGGFMFPAPLF